MTTEQIKPHLKNFTNFVIDCKHVPPPRNMKVTLYFDGTAPGVKEMLIEDTYFERVGVVKVFTKSWIEHSELLKLLDK